MATSASLAAHRARFPHDARRLASGPSVAGEAAVLAGCGELAPSCTLVVAQHRVLAPRSAWQAPAVAGGPSLAG